MIAYLQKQTINNTKMRLSFFIAESVKTVLVGVVIGGASVDLVEEKGVLGKAPSGLVQEVGKVQPAAFFLLKVFLESREGKVETIEKEKEEGGGTYTLRTAAT